MADEGDPIRHIATEMKEQVAKVNEAANKQNVQRAMHAAMRTARTTGGKSVTFRRRRA